MPKFFIFLIVFAFVMPAWASDWVDGEHVRARLAAVPDGGNGVAMLEVELEDGWHTYGQDPGDAGLPPRFEWEGSSNLKDVEIEWPETFEKREMDMFTVNAYEGTIHFPLAITPEDAQGDVALKLGLKLMVCKDICIPSTVDLALDLKAGLVAP
ncbi:MAG: hypothetical protein H6860_05820 [Rhodospirillales bacterium]|nr:hypothetical protein [Alphaproteobacteria bacterium]MCB9981897.1 hypothetical protein [Rhodospirillales bacterium]